MFLELSGKLFFSKLRPAIFYAFLLIPFFFTGSYLFQLRSSQQELESRFREAMNQGKAAYDRKTRKERFVNRYSNSDPFFLDKHIESRLFLNNERNQIESMINHPALLNKKVLSERLEFLRSGKNRIAFIEENIRTSGRLKETEEKQRHPVQIDEGDLQNLLSAIEDIPVGPYEPLPQTPQLLVREMKIRKVENPLRSEVYELEMELLKREWTNP